MEHQTVNVPPTPGDKPILDIVLGSAHQALRDYLLSMTDGTSSPECWLQCEVARALAATRQYYVYLERKVRDLVSDANSGRDLAQKLKGRRQTGNVDLALYHWTPDPGDAPLSSIIELKRLRNPWHMDADARRILHLNIMWDNTLSGIVAAVTWCAGAQGLADTVKWTAKSLSNIAHRPIKVEHSPLVENWNGHYAIIAAQIC